MIGFFIPVLIQLAITLFGGFVTAFRCVAVSAAGFVQQLAVAYVYVDVPMGHH